jgi:hypothetical protein
MLTTADKRPGDGASTVNRERRSTRLLVLVVIGLAAGFAMGQTRPARPGVVEAEGFVLRDARGRTRAHLSLIADGSVALGLANQSGDSRAALVVGVDGTPQLALQDANGKTRVIIGMQPGGVGIRLQDATGKVVWSTP